MRDLLFKSIIFLVGGVVGSAITWKVAKRKYERIDTEENNNEQQKNLDDSAVSSSDFNIQQIRDNLQELRHINEEAMEESNKEEKRNMFGPQVIEPPELWELDYPMITLIYYEKDQVLADDRNRIIKNVDELVGEDFADHFGEYEEDTVYIRNNELCVYYEILRDYGSYEESI